MGKGMGEMALGDKLSGSILGARNRGAQDEQYETAGDLLRLHTLEQNISVGGTGEGVLG